MRRERWIELLASVALVVACTLAYSVIFETWIFLVPVTGAALGASLVTAYCYIKKLPIWTAMGVSAAVGAIYISYAVLVDTLAGGIVPSTQTWQLLRHGIARGFGDTLQAALPVQGQSSTHVFVVAFVWVAAMSAAELVVRTKSIVTPTIGPLCVFAVSLPLAAPLSSISSWIVSVAIAAVLSFILVRSAPEFTLQARARADRREVTEFHSRSLLSGRLTLGIPIIIVVSLLGPALSTFLTPGDADPFDPRDLRDDSIDSQSSINPLAQLKSVINRPETEAFTVDFRSDAEGLAIGHVKLVTLDRYTGADWFSTSSYLPSRGSLSSIAGMDKQSSRSILAEIELTGIVGPWLPTLGEPTNISIDQVLFDDHSRDILAGDATTYSVEGIIANPSAAQLDAAVADRSEAFSDLITLDPAPPQELVDLAATLSQDSPRPIDQLRRIEEFVRTVGLFDSDAPPGHSYRDIVTFLSDGRPGYSEHYATAFAILARIQGFPTRLVVGYRVIQETDGEIELLTSITNRQYHVWPEVRLDVGWVAFEPTPLSAEETVGQQPDEGTPEPTVGPGDLVNPQDQPAPREEGPTEQLPTTQDGGFSKLVQLSIGLVLVGAILVTMLGLLIVIVKQRRRTRRRTAAATNDRVLGAWAEAHDRMIEAGLSVPAHFTVEEAIAACRGRFGGGPAAPLQALAPHVDRAVFAEFAPAEAVATQAWSRTEDFEHALAPQLTRIRRFYARVDPRTLRSI